MMANYILLDGYSSRTEYKFLECANNDKHKRIVSLRVLCSIALWQVDDRTEQNSSFNVALGKAKSDLVIMKQSLCVNVKLVLTNVMYLINKAQDNSFAIANTNKVSIVERG